MGCNGCGTVRGVTELCVGRLKSLFCASVDDRDDVGLDAR